MRNFPKKWVPLITAMKYVKYYLEDDSNEKFRDVTTMFFKSQWNEMYHVIIEDKEMGMPDYYFMSKQEILETFGSLDFLTEK